MGWLLFFAVLGPCILAFGRVLAGVFGFGLAGVDKVAKGFIGFSRMFVVVCFCCLGFGSGCGSNASGWSAVLCALSLSFHPYIRTVDYPVQELFGGKGRLLIPCAILSFCRLSILSQNTKKIEHRNPTFYYPEDPSTQILCF